MRNKRQQDIAQQAQNENTDQQEIVLRNQLLVQKVWAQYFKRKMSKEMDKFRPIELAFQEIRAKTGNTDVRLLVEKFMNKEQTYASLLTAVKANENKYEKLRTVNMDKMH